MGRGSQQTVGGEERALPQHFPSEPLNTQNMVKFKLLCQLFVNFGAFTNKEPNFVQILEAVT